MKLTAVILISACLTASANGFSQITLSEKNTPLQKVFKKIQQQTGYEFLWPQQLVAKAGTVTVELRDVGIDEALQEVLKGKGMIYLISERTVVIKERRNNEDKTALAPPIDIRGRVINEKGEPVESASVQVKGTNTGTFTDLKGEFQLPRVNENATLVISGVSIETKEIKVGGKTDLSIYVKIKAAQEETVTINAGYYRVGYRERTGNISRVDSRTIEKQPVNSPLLALQGRVPGLQITQRTGVPGGGFDVLVRGKNSISSGSEPLYVINGVPYTSAQLNSSTISNPTGGSSPLNFINPQDIESIEVLKDADATAIYGSRGANGVILITTKKGKVEKTLIDINVFSGIGQVSKKMDLLNKEQYLRMRHEAFSNDGKVPGPADYDVNGTWDSTHETDWQDVLLGGNSKTTNITATVSGGSENTQFLVGSNYYRETLVFPGDFAFSKASLNCNINHTSANKKFTISLSGNFLTHKSNFNQTDLTGRALSLAPVSPALYDGAGKLNWANSTWTNPIYFTLQTYESRTDNLIGSGVISYKIIPGLEIKANLGYNSLRFNEINLVPKSSFDPAWGLTSGASTFGINSTKSWIVEPQVHFSRQISRGNLDVLVGSTFNEEKRDLKVIAARNFPNDAMLRNILAASTLRTFDADVSTYRYNAVFARINYNWQKKYIINATARRDGSSRFGPGKQFANFGAVGAAWIFSNEDFLKTNRALSYGKLRASLGTTGNDQIGNYRFLDAYSPTTNAYLGIAGLTPTRLFNPDFGWESTTKMEAGLELGFFRDRIYFSISYYRNRSSNQLLNYPLAPSTGFSGVQTNLPATIQNSGMEFELNTTNITGSEFTWRTSLNITVPKDKLVAYPNLSVSSHANVYAIGKPLGIKKVLHSLGVDPQTGIYTFEDLNGNGNNMDYPADLQALKAINQKFYGGILNSFHYKGISLDIFFQFVKQTGYSYKYGFGNAPGFHSNQPVEILNRWQKPGDITDIQKFTQESGPAYTPWVYTVYVSDNTITDASFLRLKNLSLSYQLPASWINSVKIKNARIYIQGQNLLTITNYIGLNPENQSFQALPPLRVLTGGIQLTF